MKCKLLATIAFLLATTAVSSGADLLRGTIPSQSAEADWSGAYVGAGVTYSAFRDTDDRFGGFESKGSGLDASFHVGYMHQISNNIVVGIEADYSRLNAAFTTLPPFFPDLEVETVASLRGRLGVAFDKVQPYVTAGIVYADTSFDGLDDTGLALGIGLDVKVTDNVLFGFQYQHHEFYDFGGDPIDVQNDVGTARLSYQF